MLDNPAFQKLDAFFMTREEEAEPVEEKWNGHEVQVVKLADDHLLRCALHEGRPIMYEIVFSDGGAAITVLRDWKPTRADSMLIAQVLEENKR